MRFNYLNTGMVEMKNDSGVLLRTVPNNYTVKVKGDYIVIFDLDGKPIFKDLYSACYDNTGVAIGFNATNTYSVLIASYFSDVINTTILSLDTDAAEEASDLTNIEAKVDAIQADIGDPSTRTRFPSIATMIGVPDDADSCLDDMLRTGFNSTTIGANVDGSVMERLEDLVVKVTAVDDLIDGANLEKFTSAADGGTNAYPDSVAQDSQMAYILSKANPAVKTSYDNTTDSLEAISDKVTEIITPAASVMYQAGRCNIFSRTVTSASDAGYVTIATVTDNAVWIEGIVLGGLDTTAIHANLTSAAVNGGAAHVIEFISAATAVAANLNDANEQVSWSGQVVLPRNATITINFVGVGAGLTGIEISIKYRPIFAGGYLA